MVRVNDRVGGIYEYINMVRTDMVLTGMHVEQIRESALIDLFLYVT